MNEGFGERPVLRFFDPPKQTDSRPIAMNGWDHPVLLGVEYGPGRIEIPGPGPRYGLRSEEADTGVLGQCADVGRRSKRNWASAISKKNERLCCWTVLSGHGLLLPCWTTGERARLAAGHFLGWSKMTKRIVK